MEKSRYSGFKNGPSGKDLADYAWVDDWREEKDERKRWAPHEWKERFYYLSKKLSSTLRHTAAREGLTIREDGFIRVRDMASNRVYDSYTVEDILTSCEVGHNSKDRFELIYEGGLPGVAWVRARQGHSATVGDVDAHKLTTPVTVDNVPLTAIHGTFDEVLPAIREDGLKTMGRLHIHMATGLPTDGTVISGCRNGTNVFLYVDVKRGIQDGIEFLRSGNDVILTPGLDGVLPPKYFIGATDKKGKLIFGEDPQNPATALSWGEAHAQARSSRAVPGAPPKDASNKGSAATSSAPQQSTPSQPPSQLTNLEKNFLKSVKNFRAILKLEELDKPDKGQQKKIEKKPEALQELRDAEGFLPNDSELRVKNQDIMDLLGK